MFSQTYAPCQFRLSPDWQCQPGDTVEIHNGGNVVRRGIVEAVMSDGSGLWLAANGTDQRAYFHNETGIELWIQD